VDNMSRICEINRKTKETDITLSLSLEGGEVCIETGIGFFDHMLTSFAVHSGFGLKIKAIGDLNVDCHHTVEDVGIVLGQALKSTVGDKKGIKRLEAPLCPWMMRCAFVLSISPAELTLSTTLHFRMSAAALMKQR